MINETQQKYAARIAAHYEKKLLKQTSNKFKYRRYQFKSTPVLFLKENDQMAIRESVHNGIRLYATATIITLLQSCYDDMQFGFIIDYFGEKRKIMLAVSKEMLVLKG